MHIAAAKLYAQVNDEKQSFMRPIVTNIKAEIGSRSSIVLSWTMPDRIDTDPIDEILVYRSPVAIKSFEQIQSITPKDVLKTASPATNRPEGDNKTGAKRIVSTWVDKKPLKTNGFYAVVLSSAGKRLPVIIPSVNATIEGCKPYIKKEVQERDTAEESYNPLAIPLPDPTLSSQDDDALGKEALEKERQLSIKGVEAGGGKTLFPYIFKEDIVCPQSGDDVFLFDILKTTFIKEKYSEAENALNRLLRTNMTPSVTTRSSFYLGECYYFTGQYERAIKQFLSVRSSFEDASDSSEATMLSSLCSSWIDSSLDLLSLSMGL